MHPYDIKGQALLVSGLTGTDRRTEKALWLMTHQFSARQSPTAALWRDLAGAGWVWCTRLGHDELFAAIAWSPDSKAIADIRMSRAFGPGTLETRTLRDGKSKALFVDRSLVVGGGNVLGRDKD